MKNTLCRKRLFLARSPAKLNGPHLNGIRLVYAVADSLELASDRSEIAGVRLSEESRIECDMTFLLLGVRLNTQIAHEMGVALDDEGYLLMDEEWRTTAPGVFAAGDLTRMYIHQAVSAVHAGAEAAQTMNCFLYSDGRKNAEDAGSCNAALFLPLVGRNRAFDHGPEKIGVMATELKGEPFPKKNALRKTHATSSVYIQRKRYDAVPYFSRLPEAQAFLFRAPIGDRLIKCESFNPGKPFRFA